MAQLPNVPGMAQAGYPDLDAYASFSVVVPSGVSPAIVQRLGAEIVKAMKLPSLAEKLESQALVPVFDSPQEFALSLGKERDAWAAFIRRNDIRQEE